MSRLQLYSTTYALILLTFLTHSFVHLPEYRAKRINLIYTTKEIVLKYIDNAIFTITVKRILDCLCLILPARYSLWSYFMAHDARNPHATFRI